MQKKKTLILAAVAAVVLIAALAAVYLCTRPAVSQGSKTVAVEVVHKDGSTKTFTYRTDAEYLGEVLLDEGLVKGEEGAFGLFITEVDGETADFAADGGWWGLYQNGEMTASGADSTPIADGDSFSLVYSVG